MKNIKSLLILLSAVTLTGCVHNNGECYEHVDKDNDGYCDVCKKELAPHCDHVDEDKDGKCDKCGESMPLPTPEPTPEPSTYTVYLVVGQYGKLNGSSGDKIPEMFLEHAIAFTKEPGTKLPGKDEVKHADPAKFEFAGWLCYENSGAPVIYTEVPKSNNKIMYASFNKIGGQN